MATLTGYQAFIKRYFKEHNGATMKSAAAAWQAQSHTPPKKRRSPASCASTIVPTADGSGVTTRGGAHLRASFEGHTEVKFDQGALGAVWAGIITGLRQSNAANLAALFPDLYPDAYMAMQMNRSHADEFQIGIQMAPMMGAALVAYRVTPDEIAGWVARAVSQTFVIPAERGMCVSVTAALTGQPATIQGLPAQAGGAGQMGGVLGAPGGALPQAGGNYGQLR